MTAEAHDRNSYVALCGGIGGAKLVLGLAQILPPDAFTVIVNTGDDFEHVGLNISPDIDTVIYTLAGIANPETGWGRKDETWSFMSALVALGGPGWFKLGDRDLAMHLERTRWLWGGGTLSDFCLHVREKLGVGPLVLPASDDPVRTMLETSEGRLAFQDYFVARKCAPQIRAIDYERAAAARAAPLVLAALKSPALKAIIICPSNPYLSIDPILAIPGLRLAIKDAGVPVVAVTPVIGGEAVKGPTAKIMRELGIVPCAAEIVRHYGALLNGFVLDRRDEAASGELGLPVHIADTLMTDLASKAALATEVLAFCTRLKGQP